MSIVKCAVSWLSVGLVVSGALVAGCGDGTKMPAGLIVSPQSGLRTREAKGEDHFTVMLSTAPTSDVRVQVESSDVTEGTVAPDVLTFTAANWNAPQTVTVSGVDDSEIDGDQRYQIVVTPHSEDPAYSGLPPSHVEVTNVDDDVAGITVTAGAHLETTEAGGMATFQVQLNAQPTAPVTIGLSSSNPKEGTVEPARLTFTVDNWRGPQVVTVTGVDDAVADGAQRYQVVTAPAESADAHYQGKDADDVELTNVDDDSAGIGVQAASGLKTGESGDTATFTIVLRSEPTADVTIALSSSNQAEGTVAPQKVVFTKQNWKAPQTVTITGVDDAIADGNQPYQILTAPAESADARYQGVNADDVAVTNTDNDSAGVLIDAAPALQTDESGGTASFSLKLASQPRGDVVIAFASDTPSEGRVGGSTNALALTFTASNWSTAQTVVVTGQDDSRKDGNPEYQIRGTATSTDPGYQGATVTVKLINVDNDVPAVLIGDAQDLSTSESGDGAGFSVRLASEPAGTVTITLTSSNPQEGVFQGGLATQTLTFDATNWSAPQPVRLVGVADPSGALDGAQPYEVRFAIASPDADYAALPAAPLTQQLVNLDGNRRAIVLGPTPASVNEGSSLTLHVQLAAQPEQPVTLALTSDPPDALVATPQVVIQPADWNHATAVQITAKPDDIDRVSNLVARLQLSVVDTGDPLWAAAPQVSASFTIVDRDHAGIDVTAALSLAEGQSAPISLKLKSKPLAPVTISLDASGLPLSVTPPTVTIQPEQWNQPVPLTIAAIDDDLALANSLFPLPVKVTASDDAGYRPLTATVAVSVVQNDAGIEMTPASQSVAATEPLVVTVRLLSPPTGDVFFTVGLRVSGDIANLVDVPGQISKASWQTPVTVKIANVEPNFHLTGTLRLDVTSQTSDPAYQHLPTVVTDATIRAPWEH